MKRILAFMSSILLGAVFLVSTGPAATAAPYCGITWGSIADVQTVASMNASLTGVRDGRQACYDRLVLDVKGDIRGFDVRYVNVVRQEGSGAAVPLRGAADLRIVALVPSYDTAGHPTYTPANQRELVSVAGFTTFRQVAYAGSMEGQTTLGLGVRARLPFRTFILDGPGSGSRLVVDVAHYW